MTAIEVMVTGLVGESVNIFIVLFDRGFPSSLYFSIEIDRVTVKGYDPLPRTLMVLHFSNTSRETETIELRYVIEKTESGQISAYALEFPEYRVEADTEEEAIEKLDAYLDSFLSERKIIFRQFQIPPAKPENPWMKFAGVFKDSPIFAEIAEEIRAERRSIENDVEDE
ncbi:hypothetical protein V0288_17445 [Pannus brasiliensis CCIBt3594]|uniref:Uncharacterized protein n=1 Tax=Pannus brasiliensis CCIBt3594 TaxID=1427578 RepID=A0AAW9QXJ4_9CHRO